MYPGVPPDHSAGRLVQEDEPIVGRGWSGFRREQALRAEPGRLGGGGESILGGYAGRWGPAAASPSPENLSSLVPRICCLSSKELIPPSLPAAPTVPFPPLPLTGSTGLPPHKERSFHPPQARPA